MDTPQWSIDDTVNVYEPAEDSFLLLDALEADLVEIKQSKPRIVLEIGCGSGVIITALSKALKNSAFCFTVDINREACQVTHRTALMNNAQVEVITMDLVSCLKLQCTIDLLVFNPPYVVTPDEEVTGQLERAWAGGRDGRVVMDRLFPQIGKMISSNGRFYLVVIDENKPDEIKDILIKDGFRADVIAKRKVRGENLSILRFLQA